MRGKLLKFFAFILFGMAMVLYSVRGYSQSNSAPQIDNVPNQVVLEDVAMQSITLTGISDGDGFTQTLTISYSSSNLAILVPLPIIYNQGETTAILNYQPQPDANGVVFIRVTIMDDGGSGMGSIDSNFVDFTITVNTVNDKPTFTKGADIPVTPNLLEEDAGALTFAAWASDINTGGTIGNENFQDLNFVLTIFETQGNLTFDNLSVSKIGNLTFMPTANTNGLAKIKIELQDDGGDILPDENTSEPDTLIITVTAVNDAPVFTGGNDVTVVEGDGLQTISGWASGMSPGGGSDETGQNLTFILTETSISNFLTYTSPPSIDAATGTLSFEADTQANGSASYDVTLVDDGPSVSPDQNTSSIRSFIINVTSINDAPTATLPTTYSTFEDAGDVSVSDFATNLSAGGPDEETTQNLNFVVEILSTTGTLAFDINPTISSVGTLEFTTTLDSNGSADLRISVFDDGSNIPPNTNVGPVVNLTINVAAVNDRPSFDKGVDPTILEDNGPITFPSWVQNISVGPIDEQGQTLTFQLTQIFTEGTIAFVSGPDISPNGDLSYETTLNSNGRAAYEVVAVDDGPSDGLNLNTSVIKAITIVIDPVNDAPTFTTGPNQVADENSGLLTIDGWATSMNPGGGTDESDQSFNFELQSVRFTGNLVFSIGPLVSPEGNLTFQTVPNTFGEAEFLINLIDDGLSDPPNVNISSDQNFTITINEINDPPVEIVLSNNSIVENQPPGSFVGTFTALDPDNVEHTFSLAAGNGDSGNASFSIQGESLLSAEEFSFPDQSLYSIRVQASDGENSIEQVLLIDILNEPVTTVTFPNAFTPNGDGENDTWLIEDIEYFPVAIINIYNRNGQRVFNSVGYTNPWDGNFEGKSLPVDTYYVIIDLDGEKNTVQGTVTILR